MSAERDRLNEVPHGRAPWRHWGPYLSERAWGTVREDYSPGGDAWQYFPHEHARSRARHRSQQQRLDAADAERVEAHAKADQRRSLVEIGQFELHVCLVRPLRPREGCIVPRPEPAGTPAAYAQALRLNPKLQPRGFQCAVRSCSCR